MADMPLQKEPFPHLAAALPKGQRQPYGRSLTWRVVLLCLILIPLTDFWQVEMEVVRYSAHPTTISLFFDTVFVLLCLTVANQSLKRFAPRLALERGELLLTYSVLCIAAAVSGHDMLEVFVPMLTWPFKHANSSNNWAHLIIPHLKPALFISDPKIYKGYYVGNDTIFRWVYIRAWLPVVCIWTAFVSMLLFVMLCINVILRKQWTEHERLTYPIIQLPLQITSEQAFAPNGLFRNRLFWLGFAIAGSIDMINSLNYYYPNIPTVLTPGFGQSFLDIGQYFTSKPWNALGWTPVSFYPFMIGLGMFMPLDFLFSMWFFYWFWKLERVAVVWLGYDRDPRFPYIENQSFGAYLSFFFYAAWLSRNYIKQVLRCALGRPSELDDSTEPIRYRWAVLGVILGVGSLVAFSTWLGMVWWIGILFFFMYFMLAIAITRMRAELGTPVHDLHFTGPEMIMTRVAGTDSFSANTLTVFSLYFWFNRAYRSHPMPHQLEGFKLAEQTHSRYRSWYFAMLFLGIFGVFVAFWNMLGLMYHYGAEAKSVLTFGPEPYNNLTSWLNTPTRGKFGELMSIFVGCGIAFFLQWMRVRFPWWPFHPLAFAVTSSWEINLVWGPLFLAWIFKGLILRYGGRGAFQKALPFFIGLMLGQFVVGSLWNIYGIARGLPTYQFWQ
ncbi:MAG TPA: DUF6785 family protein [Chthonomonas sp.]|uniref:DUF6785 family protein n=1 Tax=Chthonomonas sp. TaxID=2282153 RepID=UPI002B4B33F5|nr:DUF6785 family protein [Chthonomonas sp.]HLH79742.1 DUF6785 family protein [Chthonomonas sp.]